MPVEPLNGAVGAVGTSPWAFAGQHLLLVGWAGDDVMAPLGGICQLFVDQRVCRPSLTWAPLAPDVFFQVDVVLTVVPCLFPML